MISALALPKLITMPFFSTKEALGAAGDVLSPSVTVQLVSDKFFSSKSPPFDETSPQSFVKSSESFSVWQS